MKKFSWIFAGLLLMPAFADEGGRPMRVTAGAASAVSSAAQTAQAPAIRPAHMIDEVEYRDEDTTTPSPAFAGANPSLGEGESRRASDEVNAARSAIAPGRVIQGGAPAAAARGAAPTRGENIQQVSGRGAAQQPQQAAPARLSPMAAEMQTVSRAAVVQQVNRGASATTPAIRATPSPSEGDLRRTGMQPSAGEGERRPTAGQPAAQVNQVVQARAAVNRGVQQAAPQGAFRGNNPVVGAAQQQARAATTRQSVAGARPVSGDVAGRAVAARQGSQQVTAAAANRVVARSALDEGGIGIMPISDPFGAAPAIEAPSPSDALAACSAQYFDCLNQFCNVLDQNQRQCSCSSRLNEYREIEANLQRANDELNEVANQIRFVGLSAHEIRAILQETEAEQVMSMMEDRTQSRNMLAEIERLIMEPTSSGASFSNNNNSFSFDMDFSFSGDMSLDSLFGNNQGSFANMRGEELYNAAKRQCQPLLTRCASNRTDQQIIQGQYDIEIDRACLQFEAGLIRANQAVRANIRAATQMLQRARLAVMHDQNDLDARGCVAALDSCMRDNMVCGQNHRRCVDPTRTAIDEAGGVVMGGDVIAIRGFAQGFNAMALGNLLENHTCERAEDSNNGCLVVQHLKAQIGVSESGIVQSGFCRPVLDRCRMITHSSDGTYNPNNTVVRAYMERTVPAIRAEQERVISEFASTCISQVQTCYNAQMASLNLVASNQQLSPEIVRPVLMGACRNVALSCAFAVFQYDSARCVGTGVGNLGAGNNTATDCQNGFIDRLSEMFFQSMMCPLNSIWDNGGRGTDPLGTDFDLAVGGASPINVWVNSNCRCLPGFVFFNGGCTQTPTCPANSRVVSETGVSETGVLDPANFARPFCRCNHDGAASGITRVTPSDQNSAPTPWAWMGRSCSANPPPVGTSAPIDP